MGELTPVNHEKEACLGLSTLGVAQRIVKNSPKVQVIRLRPYFYIPNKPSGVEEQPYGISREQFLEMEQADLDDRVVQLGEGYNIALDSPVVLRDGSKGHFVMADLAPSKSDENLERIIERFRDIIMPRFGGGFFLGTKKSYHFIGENFVSQDEWHELLGRLLITSIVTVTPEGIPNLNEVIADYRYIGHSLIRGSTGLRLTTNGTKTVSPSVVGFV
jgi:hypothetical protein